MFRIDGPGSVTGHWSAGDPTHVPPIPSTKFTRDWVEDLQESLISVVVDSGQTPTKLDFTQISNGARYLGQAVGSGKTTKNLLDNSDFFLFQRNVTGLSFFGTAYVADRWFANGNAGSTCTTISPITIFPSTVPEPNALLHIEDQFSAMRWQQTLNGTGLSTFEQRQPELLGTLAGQTVTVSIWAHLNTGSTPVNVIPEFEQNFGGGGSAAVITTGPTWSVTSTWTRFQWTVTLPSIAAKSKGTLAYLATRFKLPSGSTFDLAFSWVQLELGPAATSYKHPGMVSDYLECCRYYFKTHERNVANSSTAALGQLSSRDNGTEVAGIHARFPVEMIQVPTITWYAPSTGASGKVDRGGTAISVTGTVGTSKRASGYPQTATQADAVCAAHMTAEAEL